MKGGFDVIARRANATIVPVVIDGAFEIWSRHQKFPGMGNVRVVYGKAITPKECKEMSREELVSRVNQQLHEMQSDIRRRYGRKVYDYS